MIEIDAARRANLRATAKAFSTDVCKELATIEIAVDAEGIDQDEQADSIEVSLFEIVDRVLLARLQFELRSNRPGTVEQSEARVNAIRDMLAEQW